MYLQAWVYARIIQLRCMSCRDFQACRIAMLACSACPSNSTSTPSSSGQEDCLCTAGVYDNYISDTLLCSICTAGSWCPGQGAKFPCTACSNSQPVATSAEFCMCEISMFKTDEICFACPVNFYCPGDNKKYACPGHSTSQGQSQTLSDCTCEGGYEKLE